MKIKTTAILWTAMALSSCNLDTKHKTEKYNALAIHVWPPEKGDSVKYRGRIFFIRNETEILSEEIYATKNTRKLKSVFINSAKDTVSFDQGSSGQVIYFPSKKTADKFQENLREELKEF